MADLGIPLRVIVRRGSDSDSGTDTSENSPVNLTKNRKSTKRGAKLREHVAVSRKGTQSQVSSHARELPGYQEEPGRNNDWDGREVSPRSDGGGGTWWGEGSIPRSLSDAVSKPQSMARSITTGSYTNWHDVSATRPHPRRASGASQTAWMIREETVAPVKGMPDRRPRVGHDSSGYNKRKSKGSLLKSTLNLRKKHREVGNDLSDNENEALDQAIAQMRGGESTDGPKVVGGSSETPRGSQAEEAGGEPDAYRASLLSTASRKFGNRASDMSKRRTKSAWSVLKKAVWLDKSKLSRAALHQLDAQGGRSDSDEDKADIYKDGASSEASQPLTETGHLPRTRLAPDDASWVYRAFNKLFMRWQDFKQHDLNPMRRREGGSLLQQHKRIALGDDDNMPVNIQLLKMGTDTDHLDRPGTEQDAAEKAPKGQVGIDQIDLSGKVFYFHLVATEDRLDITEQRRRIFCQLVVKRSKWRSQRKHAKSEVLWGETFAFEPRALEVNEWTILVQVFDIQDRFLGEAEIDVSKHADEFVAEKPLAIIHSEVLTAENEAGRQFTGKVRYAIWLRPSNWWDQRIDRLLGKVEEGAEPQTSLQLPEHLPRPFPAVLHLPFATMYEEPLVTFLFFKIVKLRARTSRKGRFKVESSRQGHGHSGAGSHRQGFIQVNKPQKLFMAANSKARQSVAAAKERIRAVQKRPHQLGTATESATGSDLLSDFDSLDWGEEENGDDVSGSGVNNPEASTPSSMSSYRYELKVSLRSTSRSFRFAGAKDLKDFVKLNVSVVFPITNELRHNESIGIQITRGPRRIVADTSVRVQSLLDSISRLPNTHEEGILWNLDGQWPGGATSFGEALLCYGAANADRRGGLAASQPSASADFRDLGPMQSRMEAMDFQDLSVKGRAMEQSSRLPRESSFASRSMSREPPIIPEERHPKAPRSLAAPPPIDKAVGPMGFVKVVIHGLKIQDLATCYCVLQCSNYWVRTHVISLDARSKWPVLAFVIPLWVPDEQVVLAVFGMSAGIRNNVPLIGKCRFRISSLKPSQELNADFPLVMERSSKGFATMTIEWRYSSIGRLLRSYFKPRQPDNLFHLGVHTKLKNMDKEVLRISMEWLEDCPNPPVAMQVSKKALSTNRDALEFKTVQANWARIMAIIDSIKKSAAAFEDVALWRVPWLSILANLGCVCFVVYPHIVVSMAAVAVAASSFHMRLRKQRVREGEGERDWTAGAGEENTKELQAEEAKGPEGLSINKMRDMALMIQNIMDDIASSAERLQSFTNWRDPTATLVVCVILLMAAPLVYLLGVRVLIAFGLLWALRPPMLRDPITPAPAVFFMMLPTQVHSMLAPELLKDDREEPRAT